MNCPLVSVIIPVYNAKDTLERCVESLIFQPYKNIEVILIEDYSSDGSRELCNTLQKQFTGIKVLFNEKNMGVSATRNRGLDVALGELVVFVDSDDWVAVDYFVDLVKLISDKDIQLAICGFWHHNEIDNKEPEIFIFGTNNNYSSLVPGEVYELVDKWHFGALWNKIFRRDIIEKNGIRFAEALCIGEDTRFGIEYLAAIPKGLIGILSKPLYHYIQVNSNSLWFRNADHIKAALENNELMYKLLNIEQRERYRENYYKIINGKFECYMAIAAFGKGRIFEKLTKINSIYNQEVFRTSFKNWKGREPENALVWNVRWIYNILCRDIKKNISSTKMFYKRITGRLIRERRMKLIRTTRRTLFPKNRSIISQNCIGGVFYHDMGMKFLSPTVNLYFEAPDFVKFIKNLPNYIARPLEMQWGERYPVGYLDDVKIHFMHYSTCREAKRKWEGRVKRVDLEHILILCTDMEGFDDAAFETYKKVMYPKLLFTGQKKFSHEPFSIYYPEYRDNSILDLIPARKFYKNNKLLELFNGL